VAREAKDLELDYRRHRTVTCDSSLRSSRRFINSSSLVWGRDNRTCAFRVGDGPALRIERRLPGGDANAYFAYAAIIGAGLHGIARRIEPPVEHRGNG
jgi:glutamine synthetase